MTQPAKRATLIGSGVMVAECALTLAQLGVEVSIIDPFVELGPDSSAASQDMLHMRPLLLRAATHPRIKLYTNAKVESISRRQGTFAVRATRHPRYVRQDICTSCGRCTEACAVEIPFVQNRRWLTHSAIHPPLLGAYAVPSAYAIDKTGIAPCTASCPLGINVSGFVSLLAKDKVDRALALINEAAPLAGVLGRVCTHPCEDSCKRAEVDDPVFIKALHRYAADSASSIKYTRKAPSGSRKDRFAIVGSGPAGLTAAWELARRGYSPIVFESHAVIGGMLATGIPRFRLPREVREREVKAIQEMGVEIRTGVTIGRDITLSGLRELGYRAFFLAIGAHENRKLNIPGEDLEGVVDSISLLFELNLKVGASVGRNVVVIGGGNSAVDSARAARRRGKTTVTILYRRTAEELTAVKEDVEEALKEGISIEYLISPLEILGDAGKVTGIRCQRMRLGDPGADSRRQPVPIPGSEFVIEADHVVLAIGQRPATAQLGRKNLNVDDDEATIKVDPLTLETGLPGVFAGGDCVTGSNTVVDAIAAGLRAAESIDRYLRGRSLRKVRSLERPQAAEVEVEERHVTPYRRAEMPFIPRLQRMATFEETSLGLSPKAAQWEAERCIHCTLCSDCKECEEACKLGAVFHGDSAENIEVAADAIVNFGPTDGSTVPVSSRGEGVYTVQPGEGSSLWDRLFLASSTALRVASQLALKEDERQPESKTAGRLGVSLDKPSPPVATAAVAKPGIGLILCQCGGDISSVIDFAEVVTRVENLPNACVVGTISQACTEQGAQQVADLVAERQLDRVVLAACRCCNQDQICFSCTDRRVMCRQYLDQISLAVPSAGVEFVNIREQCAWVHKDDPANATHRAIEIISAGIARIKAPLSAVLQVRSAQQSVVVIGAELGGLAAASDLAAQGYSVELVSRPVPDRGTSGPKARHVKSRNSLLRRLQAQGIRIRPWPDVLDIAGSPGDYRVVLRYGSETEHLTSGAVILDLGETGSETSSAWSAISGQSLLGRILGHKNSSCGRGIADSPLIREVTIGDTAGIFVIPSGTKDSAREQTLRGTAIAAKAWAYLAQDTLRPRATAVVIDSKLCRGCGDCAVLCPYMEMRNSGCQAAYAYVDPALCLGCGACISRCPTGAINQPLQGDEQIISTLEAMFTGKAASGVG